MSSTGDPDCSRGQNWKLRLLKSEIYMKMYRTCAKKKPPDAFKTTVFHFVNQNNSPAFCIQTAQIRRPAWTLPYSAYCISDHIFGCMDSLSYRQIRYLCRKMEWLAEESYGACNISDTCAEIPRKNILHAPHFGFSCPRLNDLNLLFVCFGATAPQWASASSFTRFLDHTKRRTIVGRTPLDER